MTEHDTSAKNHHLLKAITALLVYEYESKSTSDTPRIELILAAGGLDYKEIAEVLGKKPDAVRMFLKRQQAALKKL